MKSIYMQLKEMALPLIEAYHDDLLKHDRREIRENPGVRFLHFTGSTGTHMIMLKKVETYPDKDVSVTYLFGKADREHMLNEISTMTKALRRVNRGDLIVYFDGKSLKKTDFEGADAIIDEYVRDIRKSWHEDKPRSWFK